MTRAPGQPVEEIRGPNGQLWGRVSGEVYMTHRTPGMFCRRYQGWGIQLDLLRDLKRMGVREIVVVVSGHALCSLVEDWDRHARIGILNPDHGEQAFLGEEHFRG